MTVKRADERSSGAARVRLVDRNTLLWTLVVFFGASIVFGAIRRATDDESAIVSLGVAVLALAAMIAAITFVVRRRR